MCGYTSKTYGFTVALLGCLLSSCFHTAGRLSFVGEGEKAAVLDLRAGDVRFVADLAVRYTGEAVARYTVELLQAGRIVSQASCNPLRPTEKRSCKHRFGNHDFDCSFIMDCRAHLEQSGPTLVRARLSIPTKPADFALARADLVIGE